jgi:hypothetical protein
MNTWQVCQQLQFLLRAKLWPGSATKVWDRDAVRIIEQGSELEALDWGALIPPLAVISPLGGQSDPIAGEEPDLIDRQLDVTLVTVNPSDRIGEAAIIGAGRFSATDSRNRGTLELEQPLFEAVKLLNTANGVLIQFTGYGMGIVRKDASDNFIAIQDYSFRLLTSAAKFYHPVRRLRAVSRTSEIDLDWVNPAQRFDSYRERLVRKAGATPPASPTDGTVINLAAFPSPVSTYADAGLAAGTYSYALFVTYSDFDQTTFEDLSFSAAATATGVAS